VLFDHVIGHTGQHTGVGGTDTAWIAVPVTAPPASIAPYCGRLEDVAAVLMPSNTGPTKALIDDRRCS
jgi:hypothetical protein